MIRSSSVFWKPRVFCDALMKKTKIIVGILLVFALGLLIGAMGMRLYVKHRIDQFMGSGSPRRIIPRLMADLTRELDLTPSQRDQVEEIAADLSRELYELRIRLHPEIEKTIDTHMDKISTLLTPDQQSRLMKFREKMEQRMLKKRFKKRLDRNHRDQPPEIPPPDGAPPPPSRDDDHS